MRTPVTIAAVAATGLLLVGGGTALALGADAGAAAPALAATAAGAPDRPGAPGAPAVDRATAELIALERAGGGQITKVEFDRAGDDRDDDRDDRDHWDVAIRTPGVEHDVDVDAVTGEVLDHDIDRDDRSDDDRDDRDDRRDDDGDDRDDD